MLPTILVTGCEGQLGAELIRECNGLGKVYAMSRSEFNLADFSEISRVISVVKPRFILNAAGYTAVDKAEEEVDLSNRINGYALKAIGDAAKQIGSVVVHYSTDYVFDGTKEMPYVETDRPNPISQYGRSKLLGEILLRDSGAMYFNFRISWIYANRGKNFLLTMLKLARDRETLSVVSDQFGAPTSASAVAFATASVIAQGLKLNSDFFSRHSGTYHMTCRGKTSWFDFANEIFNFDLHKAEQKLKHVKSISSNEYPTPAKRPRNSVLNNRLLEETFKIEMPDWKKALHDVMMKIS